MNTSKNLVVRSHSLILGRFWSLSSICNSEDFSLFPIFQDASFEYHKAYISKEVLT